MPLARINNHAMYYEIHGAGDPVLVMGGWGTFCHGGLRHVPRGLVESHKVITIDYRGVGESDDELEKLPTMEMYADDAIGLLTYLDLGKTHLVGLVGMGACIAQIVAIKQPRLVRSLMNMGAWSDATDPFFRAQMEMYRDVHREMGWSAFQRLVCIDSFTPEFYNANQKRLLCRMDHGVN